MKLVDTIFDRVYVSEDVLKYLESQPTPIALSSLILIAGEAAKSAPEQLKITVEINVPGETDYQTEERVVAAVGNLLEVFDFELKGESKLVRGSFFETLVFFAKGFMTPERFKAVMVSLFDGFKSVLGLSPQYTQLDLKHIQAIKEMLDSIKDLDKVVIRIHETLIVKVGATVMVEEISGELAAEMKTNPLILRNPEAVFQFFKKREQLQEIPADPPKTPDDDE